MNQLGRVRRLYYRDGRLLLGLDARYPLVIGAERGVCDEIHRLAIVRFRGAKVGYHSNDNLIEGNAYVTIAA